MKSVLVSPPADYGLLGGIALVIASAAIAFRGLALDMSVVWPLAMMFSFPHFIASYWVFYGKRGPARKHRFIAWSLPISLFIALSAGLAWPTPTPMHGLVQITLFLLYWHYLKQVYGAALWLGGKRGTDTDPRMKQGLLLVCLLLGASGYLMIQLTSGLSQTFGIYTERFPIPPGSASASRWIAVGALALLALRVITDPQGRKTKFHWSGMIPILALWTWADPLFDGTSYRLLLPIFHGAQYLPFPFRVMWNESEEPNQGRRRLRMVGLGITWLAIGWLVFRWTPSTIGQVIPRLASDRLFAFFSIFVNTHHFFIDSVSWRFRDADVRRRLLPTKAKYKVAA